MNLLTQATLYRDAADVKRYHTKRTQRTQTLGAHSFNMLMLVQLVDPDCRKQMLLAVAHHDLPELETGDIPAPIKRMHDTLGPLLDSIEECLFPLFMDFQLTPDEQLLLKWADTMELVMWCVEEFKLGNYYAKDTAERGMSWILESRKDNQFIAHNSNADNLTQQVLFAMLALGMTITVRPTHERNET